MFYFVRHGNTDYSEKDTKIYQGFGVNLAPLSPKGIQEIKATARDERLKNADLILCSPYTRAVQTAAILSRELDLEIVIETDLHEWMADKNYNYAQDDEADKSCREFEENGGQYPRGNDRVWEAAGMMKKRVMAVLEKYCHYPKVIVVGHGMMIQATTGGHHPENGEIVEFDYAAAASLWRKKYNSHF